MPHSAGSGVHRGVITGYIFKIIRESIPLSQERLAEELGVDRTTVQSWETGRRPFTSVSLGHAVAIQSKLAQLNADMAIVGALHEAAEADYLLDRILDADPEKVNLTEHPLGTIVLNHMLTELICWAVVGQTPALLVQRAAARRRGPVAASPVLETAEKQAFFNNLRVIADRASRTSADYVLLHRQACFLAGIDPNRATASWLGRIATRTKFSQWSPDWPDARSVATSLAKLGDKQLLQDFIAQAHPDASCELAGLNYWAYWVGEIGHRQRGDVFMIDSSLPWRGTKLLRHLTDRLYVGHPFIDLNVHSIWALLMARRGIIDDAYSAAADLFGHCEVLLDHTEISDQSRKEVTSIIYALRMAGLPEQDRRDERE